MIREGTLLEKEAGLHASFEGQDRPYVRCMVADKNDPNRHFECYVFDEQDIPIAIGEPIKVEVLKAVVDRQKGSIRFDCHLVKT
jgi:hypothetical protein